MVTPTMTFGGTVQAGMPPRSRIPGAEQHHVTQRNLPVHAAQSLQSDLPPRTRSPSARGGCLSCTRLPAPVHAPPQPAGSELSLPSAHDRTPGPQALAHAGSPPFSCSSPLSLSVFPDSGVPAGRGRWAESAVSRVGGDGECAHVAAAALLCHGNAGHHWEALVQPLSPRPHSQGPVSGQRGARVLPGATVTSAFPKVCTDRPSGEEGGGQEGCMEEVMFARGASEPRKQQASRPRASCRQGTCTEASAERGRDGNGI